MVQPSDFAPFNLGDILARGQEMQLRKLQIQDAVDQHQQARAEKEAYGQIFANGVAGGRPNQQTLGNLARVNPDAALKVQQYFNGLDEQSRKVEEGKWTAAGPLLVQMQHLPYAQRHQFMQSAAPSLMANGWKPEEIASFDPTDQNVDSLATAAMTVDQVMGQNKIDWHQIGENGSFATNAYGDPVGNNNPFAPGSPSAPQGGSTNPNAAFGALIQQESGGQAGIRGQKTAYGVPLGKTQMLPATAQEMAGKLGVPWRPELLTGTSPEASSYQEKLGRAYFDEGLQKYGGNIEKALKYYHGGPDESLWGPKTQTYAKSVLARTRRGAGDADTIRQKAQAAIAAGADPAKVRERAASLGVTL